MPFLFLIFIMILGGGGGVLSNPEQQWIGIKETESNITLPSNLNRTATLTSPMETTLTTEMTPTTEKKAIPTKSPFPTKDYRLKPIWHHPTPIPSPPSNQKEKCPSQWITIAISVSSVLGVEIVLACFICICYRLNHPPKPGYQKLSEDRYYHNREPLMRVVIDPPVPSARPKSKKQKKKQKEAPVPPSNNPSIPDPPEDLNDDYHSYGTNYVALRGTDLQPDIPFPNLED